jgi:hypothetical protein
VDCAENVNGAGCVIECAAGGTKPTGSEGFSEFKIQCVNHVWKYYRDTSDVAKDVLGAHYV